MVRRGRSLLLFLLPTLSAALVSHAAISQPVAHAALRAPLISRSSSSRRAGRRPWAMSAAAALPADAEAPPPIVPPRFVKVKGQVLTPYGVLLGVVVYFTAFVVQIPVFLAYLWSMAFDKKRRRAVDWIITFWAMVSMRSCGYSPEVIGKENLPKGNALYVPNHTSFLDILTLTGFVPRPMKYVSKDFILKIPLIGWPMKLAGHIALKTESRRSQLETFKDTVASLADGNSVITFPEGGRSTTGKLMPFKRGPFKMALQAKVPIVPVTIAGLARWYPKGTLLPVDVPKGVKVIIHPVVDVRRPAPPHRLPHRRPQHAHHRTAHRSTAHAHGWRVHRPCGHAAKVARALLTRAPSVHAPLVAQVVGSGLSEDELARQVYATVNSALPGYQQAPAGQEPVTK